jgi:hypothetical protein
MTNTDFVIRIASAESKSAKKNLLGLFVRGDQKWLAKKILWPKAKALKTAITELESISLLLFLNDKVNKNNKVNDLKN